ncbi:MAG: zinc-binding dehydrogenase [Armatimonadota bacterium]
MKKAVITGVRRAAVVDAPDPAPKADWALVKVHVAPMCTEYKAFVAGHTSEYLGHEAVGEVVEVAQPGRVEAGDRVVIQPQYPGGQCHLCISGDYIHCQDNYDVAEFTGSREGSATMAQYLLKPSWVLSKIPEGVSYEHASLALCGLGPSFGAFQHTGLSAFDTVLVTGMGPVGLGGVVNARFRSARVIAVESVPWRVARAEEMGVAYVVHPDDEDALARIKDLTDGKGVDCALDCSGSVRAQRLCLDATRRLGKVAFVGECSKDLAIKVSPDLIRTGITVVGAWHYNLSDFPKVMKVIQESPLIESLISHVFPMSKVQDAFETSASHECAKVLLKPWE